MRAPLFAVGLVTVVGCAKEADLDARLSGAARNSKVFVFGDDRVDVRFLRVDTDAAQELTHIAVGSEPVGDVVYIVDPGGPGDVRARETVTIQAVCDCDSGDSVIEVELGDDDDVRPPEVSPGPFRLTATANRTGQHDLLISSYTVAVVGQRVTDESPMLMRFTGDGVDVMSEARIVDETGALGAGFLLDGALERTVCGTLTLLDAALNSVRIDGNLCVQLDAETARPWGEPPASA